MGSQLFPARCLNCRAGLVGDFCHLCGQSAKTPPRITVASILRDLPNAIWTLNSALPHTLLGLLFRPGPLIRDYLEGRRARIYAPVALLFLVAGIIGLLTNALHLNEATLDMFGQKNAAQVATAEKISDYYAWVTMLTVPLSAIGPYVVLRKRLGLTFGEQLVVTAMISTGGAIVAFAGIPLEWLFHAVHAKRLFQPLMVAIFFAKNLYTVWAYAQLQDDGKRTESGWMRWGRSGLTLLASNGTIVVVTTLFAITVVLGVVVLRMYYHF